MLRVVLAVATALALLGVVLPAVDSVRRSHANAQAAQAANTVVEAARTLLARNDAVAGSPGARRVLDVELPRSSWVSRGLASFSVARAGSSATRFAWRLRGGERRSRLVVRPRLRPGSDLTVRTGGRIRLVLELVRREGHRVVRLRRPGPADG